MSRQPNEWIVTYVNDAQLERIAGCRRFAPMQYKKRAIQVLWQDPYRHVRPELVMKSENVNARNFGHPSQVRRHSPRALAAGTAAAHLRPTEAVNCAALSVMSRASSRSRQGSRIEPYRRTSPAWVSPRGSAKTDGDRPRGKAHPSLRASQSLKVNECCLLYLQLQADRRLCAKRRHNRDGFAASLSIAKSLRRLDDHEGSDWRWPSCTLFRKCCNPA